MDKIANSIIKFRKIIAAIFIGLTIFSFVSISWVNIEDDITAYLPDTAEAKRGLNVLNREFTRYASAQVMVKDISYTEAESIKNNIEKIENVLIVNFENTDQYFKENKAYYSVTFNGTSSDEKCSLALKELKELVKDKESYVYSDSFSNFASILEKEMIGVLGIVAIVVLTVLIFTSTTYAEVPVFILTFAVAAIINMGTNFIFGTISFVSNSVSIVLQLALSVDYAIIFCNRYKEEHQNKETIEAVRVALANSIPAILASSLTTIAGLVAMTFMKFNLGMDLGVSLIKSIILSLLSVFLFMPYLLVKFGRLMDKTKHKSFIPNVSFLGKFSFATKYVIPILFVGFVAFAYNGFSSVNYAYTKDLTPTPLVNEETVAKNMIYDNFGTDNLVAIMIPNGNNEKERKVVEEYSRLGNVKEVISLTNIEIGEGHYLSDDISSLELAEIAELDPSVSEVLFAYYAGLNGETDEFIKNAGNYRIPFIKLFFTLHDAINDNDFLKKIEEDAKELENFAEEEETVSFTFSEEDKKSVNNLYNQISYAKGQLQGENYHTIAVKTDLPAQSEETFKLLDELKAIAGKQYDEVYMTGDIVSTKDFVSTFEEDNRIVSLLSIGLVMLILLFTFKSIAMPILLILVIQGSIWINFAIAAWSNNYVFFMCYLIVSSIQMGANIDYAIVISSRYRELRDNGVDSKEAMMNTLNLAFPTVLTSGTMMVVSGLVIGQKVSESVVAGMGHYVGIGTIVTLILVNFVLPQVLLFGDTLISKTTINFKIPLQFIKKTAIAAIAVLALVSACLIPVQIKKQSTIKNLAVEKYQESLAMIPSLFKLCEEDNNSKDLGYDFAIQYLIDKEGSQQLQEGQIEFDKATKEIEAAQKKYDDGLKEYEDGLKEYNDGKQEYSDGLTLYNASYEEFKAGEKLYNASKAEYDEALGKFEAGQKEYNDALEQYKNIKNILETYGLIIDAYNRYQECEQNYNNAISNGRLLEASAILVEMQALRLIYETKISDGMSLSDIIEAYKAAPEQLEEARRELEDAQVQLSEGKEQLDAAKIELDEASVQLEEGKKKLEDAQVQLADAEIQLADAKGQLESGKKELANGYELYNAGKEELEEGKRFVDQNATELANTILSISNIESKREELNRGIEVLKLDDEICIRTKNVEDNKEILNVAGEYLKEQIELVKSKYNTYLYEMLALMFVCVSILIGLSINKFKKKKLH